MARAGIVLCSSWLVSCPSSQQTPRPLQVLVSICCSMSMFLTCQIQDASCQNSEQSADWFATCRVADIEEVPPTCPPPPGTAPYLQGTYDSRSVTFGDSAEHEPTSRTTWAGKQRVRDLSAVGVHQLRDQRRQRPQLMFPFGCLQLHAAGRCMLLAVACCRGNAAPGQCQACDIGTVSQ